MAVGRWISNQDLVHSVLHNIPNSLKDFQGLFNKYIGEEWRKDKEYYLA